jgi:FlaA1/EpsC-like NDP-sugar epimerase
VFPNARLLDHPLLRRTVKLSLDLLLAALAWILCYRVFFHGTSERPGLALTLWLGQVLLVNLGFRLHRQHYRLIGFKDGVHIVLATTTLVAGSMLLRQLLPALGSRLPNAVAVASALSTGGAWLLLRGAIRFNHDLTMVGSPATTTSLAHRTLIVGAGRAGLLVAKELARRPELGSEVIGFIDDALDKQGISVHGFPVLGPTARLAQLIEQHWIDQVILAIPAAAGPAIRKITADLQPLGVEIKTVPGISDLLGPLQWKPELRDVSIEDLLRRDPIEIDQPSLNRVLADAVVLITGAGGSIGSELARQVTFFRPARIVLLGRGENSLWDIERNLRELYPNQAISLELCDVRNPTRLAQVFQRWRPEVVFHAAAHKHVPYLEAHPEEAVENNIFGTRNVLAAARAAGTQTFVNISSDKAVNPTSVLGATKRIAEQLVLNAALDLPRDHRYMSVRFGNVLGSRGSVVPIFREQIKRGGPLTVTHPDMIRYFMTIPEASQLVLQAGIMGATGMVYVLDMGEPVRIVDLATDMAKLSGLVPGQDIDLHFTGIRPGEKLFEELFYQNGNAPARSSVHPKVFEAVPPACSPDLLDAALARLEEAADAAEGERQATILEEFRRLVPSYEASPTGLGRWAEGADPRTATGPIPILRSRPGKRVG